MAPLEGDVRGVNDGNTVEGRDRLSTIIDVSSTRNRHDLASPAEAISE